MTTHGASWASCPTPLQRSWRPTGSSSRSCRNTIDGEVILFYCQVEAANGHSTTLDPSPKVGPAHLDLLRLYKRVTSEGGYDYVSNTRVNKLAWRRLAMEFLPHNHNMVQFAFQVKTAYYKNLAYVGPSVSCV